MFRSLSRGDRVRAVGLGEKVVWQLIKIKPYAETAGVPGIAPHDLRRACAKLCRAAGGELEQFILATTPAHAVLLTGVGVQHDSAGSSHTRSLSRPFRHSK